MELSEKLKEIGSWVRETIIITVNEIADAVLDDIPDDLVEPMISEEPSETQFQNTESRNTELDHCSHRVYSSSDTSSTQSCDFDEPDYDYLNGRDDFPSTLDRASLISRIHTLYASGFGFGNRVLISKSCQETNDVVVVVDPATTEDVDDSGWIKL